MKILQINTVFGFGSTGRIVADLSAEISNNGMSAYVAYGQKTSSYNYSYKIGSILENHYHNLHSRIFDSQGLNSTNGTKKLVNYIADLQPDVVHLHNLHGNYIDYRILFSYLKKLTVKIIWTFHDCWPFTGHCAYFDYINCYKWIEKCVLCPAIKSYPPGWLIDNSLRNYQLKKDYFSKVENLTIVTPSEWLKRYVQQSFLSDYDTIVINNGIDTDIFKPDIDESFVTDKGLNKNIVLLGVSAEGFEGRKGLEYFIQLSSMLNSDYKLVLIGVTKNDLKKLPSNVIAVSRTNNTRELARYYSMADVFLNPTLEDNFPTTNLEALSCGTPILTFDSGGSPESVDRNSGKVVPKGDVLALHNAVSEMGKEFKVKNSYYCRHKAVSLYDKKIMYNKYMQLYK